MGTIVKMTCKGCNQAWEGYTGQGIQHGRLENVLKLYPEEVQGHVRELTTGERFPIYDFAMHIGSCMKCKALVSVPVLRLRERGTFVGLCPECGGEVQADAAEMEQQCPVCGKQDWDLQDIGRWD